MVRIICDAVYDDDDDLHEGQRSQRSNLVKCAPWLLNLEESLMQGYGDNDLHGGQRSFKVKYGKLCAMATKFGQKIVDTS